MPGSSPLVMPELIIGPLDLLIKGCSAQFSLSVEIIHNLFSWLGKFLIPQFYGLIILHIEVLGILRGVALIAHFLHFSPFLFPVLQLEGDGRSQSPANPFTHIVGQRKIWCG